ncbi:hypothetical protein Emag_002634 [Eimeria magna]
MFDEVIGASRGPSRFIQTKVRSKNPVDPEKIRRGGYATQQPRTPPEMKVRIYVSLFVFSFALPIVSNVSIKDGVDEEERNEEITEESQKTSLAAVAANQPPTEEEAEDELNRKVASKANPGAHQVPPPPAHSAGRVPPCKVQVAFRQKDDGPIDLSKEAFDDSKMQPAESADVSTAATVPDEEADSGITVVAPFKSTVPNSVRINPPQLRKEGGVPNGFYGPSRSFL